MYSSFGVFFCVGYTGIRVDRELKEIREFREALRLIGVMGALKLDGGGDG